MRRYIVLAFVGLVSQALPAWAGGLCGCETKCITPPCPTCPNCTAPCDEFCRMPSLFGCEHANKLIEDLNSCTCCDRIRAVKKLGHRAHADFCANPEVLSALIHALQCDSCWEVRRDAAWSIMLQKARTEEGVLALYIASKLDPHYLVRDRASEALDILLVGNRKECFKDTFANGDNLIKSLKKSGYKPGSPNCQVILSQEAPAKSKGETKKADAKPAAIDQDQARPLPN